MSYDDVMAADMVTVASVKVRYPVKSCLKKTTDVTKMKQGMMNDDITLVLPPVRHVHFNLTSYSIDSPLIGAPLTEEEFHLCWWTPSEYQEIRYEARRLVHTCLQANRKSHSSTKCPTIAFTLETTYDTIQEIIEDLTDGGSVTTEIHDENDAEKYTELYLDVAKSPAGYASGLIPWCRMNDGRRGLEKQLLGKPLSSEFAMGTNGSVSSYTRDIRMSILKVASYPTVTPATLAATAQFHSFHSTLFARLIGYADEETMKHQTQCNE
jgi:hypothetical protein